MHLIYMLTAQTLPASSMEKKDEPKKRGFFTLKKK